jgi:hypothetical protein
MSEKISWSFKAQVSSGPSASLSGEVTADAYDKIDVTIPASTTMSSPVTVEVQPGTGVTFLLITAVSYEGLSYKVGTGSGATEITLDGPHILIGSGAVSLLVNTPDKFLFANTETTDAKVSILVGRDATP